MPPTLDALYQAALALPEEERAELADRLLGSLPPDVSSQLHPAWRDELKRRSAQVDSGEVAPIPWDEVAAKPGMRLLRTGRPLMANVVFHPDALAEYRAALVWYGRRSRRAAQGLERAVDRVLSTAASSPEFYPLYDDIHREAILTRHPYSVLYRVRENGDLLVTAVAHASREPGYWQGR